MKVLISGAGPAGLTVAYWLRRYGFAVTIVERAPSLVTGGYKIDVRGAALQALRRMGIHDAVVAAGTDMQGAVLVDADGKVINEMSGDAFGHRASEDLEIVRGTLCQILMDHISGAEFIFGDTAVIVTAASRPGSTAGSSPASHGSKPSCASITGMRVCKSRMPSQASQVRMVQVSMPSFQRSQRPAKVKGRASRLAM